MQASLKITYLGHATCLIESAAGTILTDPHFGRRCLWRPRVQPLTYPVGQLPPLSAVLITHAHYDHLDVESFKYIPSRVPVIVPPRIGAFLHRFINNPIIELAQWVPHTVTDTLAITPVPVRHGGGRAVPGFRFPYVHGYHVKMGDRQLYFAGDTGYGTHFREVGHVYPFDIALLPIGRLTAWSPVGKDKHLNGLDVL